MIRRGTAEFLQISVLSCALIACLFAEPILNAPSGLIRRAILEIESIVRDPGTSWMVLTCLVFYLIVFSILEFRSFQDAKWHLGNSLLWQLALLVMVLLSCCSRYSSASRSQSVWVFFFGVLLGKASSWWIHSKSERSLERLFRFICLLILLLAIASVVQFRSHNSFYYHQKLRWGGPWDNPNLSGLLMGVGTVLTLAIGIACLKIHAVDIRRGLYLIIFVGTFSICAYELFKSLSRGAWIGTATGIFWLFFFYCGSPLFELAKISRFGRQKNCLHLGIVLVAVLTLCFWQFRFTQWIPAQRLFSASNANDFSWRNRVAAWRGAAQMMSDRPWFGFGWGMAETTYGKRYSPPQVENGAIQMNDYFMTGISAGVPALVCFLVYVGLSLKSPRSSVLCPPSSVLRLKEGENPATRAQIELDWLQATCRAGAIILLVGFFFDGGLFKLATGSVFWILLELGRVDVYHRGAEALREAEGTNTERLARSLAPPAKGASEVSAAPRKLARWEIWLRRSAWILGIAAVSESAVLLLTPFFGVNNTTLAISRHYLVPPSAVADLNLLATNVDWSSRKLRPLLQHSSLANYNRQLINWKLDDQMYRNYVLNPVIDPARDGQLAWRRKLWEYFYLPMRKENDPTSAAPIVLKFLHLRIATVPTGPATIDEMWQEKRTDERGIQALEVAAFRSVGIPARLNESGLAELFSEAKWRAPLEYAKSASQGR